MNGLRSKNSVYRKIVLFRASLTVGCAHWGGRIDSILCIHLTIPRHIDMFLATSLKFIYLYLKTHKYNFKIIIAFPAKTKQQTMTK